MTPIIAREPEGTVYIPAPAELQQVVCCDVVDKGLMDGPWGPKEKVQFRWFSEFEMPPDKVGEDGIPNYMITSLYTNSLHERATLRKHLTAWRGKPFTEEELKGFDLETVIGANAMILVTHNKKDDRTYGNVEAITPIRKGTPKMKIPDGYVRAKDRDDWKEPRRTFQPDGRVELPSDRDVEWPETDHDDPYDDLPF